MSWLSYQHDTANNIVTVKLFRKTVGTIKQDADGWRYYPKGQKIGGAPFKTLRLCQRSLETEDEPQPAPHATEASDAAST